MIRSLFLCGFVLLFLSSTLYSQSAQELKDLYTDLAIFKDPLATQLHSKIKKSDIKKIKNPIIRSVAEQIAAKTYDTSYRVNQFHSYLSPRTLGQNFSIGDGYSKYENITGIYLPKGDHIILVDGIAADKSVELLVPNWTRRPPNEDEPTKDDKGWGIERKSIVLHNGINTISLKEFGGLAYIGYYSSHPEEDPAVSIHFMDAAVNGYFDSQKDNNKDWDQLSENKVYPLLDAVGKHIQIIYPKEAIQKYAQKRGIELIRNYDSLVYRQHRIMGLTKYNKEPKNRILARVNYNYYMFRDGDGVAYMGGKRSNAMHMVVDPDQVIKGDPCWGFSHEVGHVHQLRPYFNWGGLAEVSNNIFALYVTTSFSNPSRLQEQNNYNKAKEELYKKEKSYLQSEDLFNRLVPFWQLHLYFSRIEDNSDFYPDLFEVFRQQNEIEKTNRHSSNWGARGDRNPATYQLNFVYQASKVGGVDLTQFFEDYGFFYVGEFELDDYGKYHYKMTQKMVDETKAKIKALNLPQPKTNPANLSDDQ